MFLVDKWSFDKSIFSGVDDFTVEAIPEGILKEYEKLNKMNISVNKDLIYFDFNKAKKLFLKKMEKDDGGWKKHKEWFVAQVQKPQLKKAKVKRY